MLILFKEDKEKVVYEMSEKKPYRVLLYYKYVPIEDPETFTQEHLAFCKELGVKYPRHLQLLCRPHVQSPGVFNRESEDETVRDEIDDSSRP